MDVRRAKEYLTITLGAVRCITGWTRAAMVALPVFTLAGVTHARLLFTFVYIYSHQIQTSEFLQQTFSRIIRILLMGVGVGVVVGLWVGVWVEMVG